MESKDELSHSKRHDADGGRHRFLWGHGRKFLRARHSRRAQIVGPEPPRRDWRGRHYLFSQWDTKGRRCKRSHRNSVADRNHNGQGINTWIGVRHRFALRAQTEREVWTGRTGRRRTTEENDKKRRFEIVILVLVALGALAAGAGIALYFAYPIRVETAAGEVRGYILSLNAPPGTVTTEENAAYKRGGAAPQAAAAAVPGAAAGDWPSYNKTLTSERFSDLSQINIANVAKLKVQCTYDTHQYSAFETGLIMVEGALIGTTEFDIFSINPARASRRRPPSTPARSYKSHSELTPKAGRPFHLSSQGEPGLASWHPEKRTSDRGKALGRPSCGDGRSKSRGMRLSAGLELGPRSLNLRAQLAKPPVIALR